MAKEDIKVHSKYVVYELNRLLGSESNLSLCKVEFKGFQSNSFDTEEEAINALIKDEKTYEDFLILKTVYLRTH